MVKKNCDHCQHTNAISILVIRYGLQYQTEYAFMNFRFFFCAVFRCRCYLFTFAFRVSFNLVFTSLLLIHCLHFMCLWPFDLRGPSINYISSVIPGLRCEPFTFTINPLGNNTMLAFKRYKCTMLMVTSFGNT